MPFRNVMITVKTAMVLHRRPCAGPGLSPSVTRPTLSLRPGTTSPTPGVRRSPRRSAPQTTATWCRWVQREITFKKQEKLIVLLTLMSK